jgi:PHP family Zn ribbon phosphoesterase
MPTCPKCRKHFRVLEDEDDGQHDCPFCGYGAREEVTEMLEETSDEVLSDLPSVDNLD